jgi:hypothetical protein
MNLNQSNMKKHYNRLYIYSLLSLLFIVLSGTYLCFGQITRNQIIKNALPYTTFVFTATSSNIWNSVNCSSVGNIITPSWIAMGTNVSVPYCWGGFSSLASFTTGLNNAKSAGDNDCTTSGDCCESCALGVDCSGFVSRAWGLTTKQSTSTIPNISTAYSSPTQVLPGDVFNYASSHVRLVYKNNRNGTYTVIESSADGWDVAVHSYTTAQLTSYVPRDYNSIATIHDTIAPTTSVTLGANWQTTNFTSNFTDADNTGGSGLEKSYYTIAEYNGSQWHGNAQRGFLTDNFVTLDTSWKIPAASGTWAVSNGILVQSDSTVNNTNIYTALNQTLSNRYIYHFKAKLTSAEYGTDNRRFGIHFFCDSATLSQRGNSYFVFFRQESSQLEFYKNVNNVSTETEIVTGVPINVGQWYDYKIAFDRITGNIDVYKDNVYIGTWTDPHPLTTAGNYISFRTGNAKVDFDSLEVFRSRYSSVTVNVGAASTNDIRYQNLNPSTPSGLIKSICNDSIRNISTIVSQKVNIDWTNPLCNTVNDGVSIDIDTTTTLTTLSANWTTSADANSGIAKYWYAIGTTSGATNVVNWTDNLLNTSVTKTGLSLTNGQHYYFSIKTVDGAGLYSICNSNGVYTDINVGVKEYAEINGIKAFPNPSSGKITFSFNLKNDEAMEISLIDKLGKGIIIAPKTKLQKGVYQSEIDPVKLGLASGTYILRINGEKNTSNVQLIILP